MYRITSFDDYNALLKILNANYQIKGQQIHLHRDMIGSVYFIDSEHQRTVFKLYRSFNASNALQTIRILEYLREKEYPAASIIKTTNNDMSININTPQGCCIGILYDYISGSIPNIERELSTIGQQVAKLHKLMEAFPNPLINRSKKYYLDDYLAVLSEVNYEPKRIAELQCYSDELWSRLKQLPKSFCHGDMHTGNMLRTIENKYVLFDFDEAAGDYPILDIGFLSDATDFNSFCEDAYDATMRSFERFYAGYSSERLISDAEINAITDIIALRHFLVLGKILRCQGTKNISFRLYDEQYEWLMSWRNLCERRKI